MRELWPWLTLIFRRPGRLVTGGLLILVTLLSGMGLLALSGWFITATALTGLLLAAGIQSSLNLYVPGGGIRFFAVARTVARYAERVYNHDTVLRLLTDIRVALFERLCLSARHRRNTLQGPQWLSRLTNDVDALDTLYLRLIAPAALAALVTVILVVVAGVFYSRDIAIALVITLLPAFLVATVVVYLRTRHLVYRQTDARERVRTDVIEHIEGFAELTAAGRTGKHAALCLRQADQIARSDSRADTRTGWNLGLAQVMVNLAVVLALWMGLDLFQQDTVTGPLVVLLPIALLGLLEIYSVLPDAFARLGGTLASAARLNRDCSAESSNATEPGQLPVDDRHALELEQVTIRFGDHSPVLSRFDLSVLAGECVNIIGSSGAGKSSLAEVMAGLEKPASGRARRRPPAYLTQQTVLFEDTLKANLLIGRPDASDAELWRILNLVEMADRFTHEPAQLNTWLGSMGSQLSGGEARRIVLARVLLNEAPLVILDEPFTGVDAPTRDRIAAGMQQWLSGKTVIALGHAPEALPASDRTIRLS
ncbi:thiol reductant ABC exporter subunit CydC [Marinobacter panjinensis]|uniref:Thiol reductant ABC exporter subunit CydC n=1 Tax=Marinobacter panjinensis TaxID=2576384 RepID=A0A4U6R0X5_9GAMM|nr:thiol reductant ABC exporter subunit CydC [Marinobacter panjinensis]MCR8915970.1 thiol reductant ABC exporter subunit CydC [Marinobacter panjinensis]TKV67063.1 thiol reductant ABC exporter subunit CydC [Marinobacter panjinensis]